MTASAPRLFFVDDEPNVLSALRRALRFRYANWTPCFFSDPAQAEQALVESPPDIIVSELRLPGYEESNSMLALARRQAPTAVRILLSGEVSLDAALAGANSAHFMLRKPFHSMSLFQVLETAQRLIALPVSEQLRTDLGKLKSLPVLPRVYQQLSDELRKEEPSTKRVAALIGEDQALMTKVLQVTNSPFFGFSSRTTEIEVAVTRLGFTTLKSLVLLVELYHGGDARSSRWMNRWMDEALTMATLVDSVLRDSEHTLDAETRHACMLAGLLYNVGKLVNLSRCEQGAEPLDMAWIEADFEHAGGYLLALWDFDTRVVQAVLHQTSAVLDASTDPVVIVLNQARRLRDGELSIESETP
ncbi:MAG: hypothetical protein CMI01_00585 [Oceanospirillaceae bacterium]|nr:hypothetical protein [Oceanospirillaceae bacterium]